MASDGGPAFPVGFPPNEGWSGISVRDYFAGQALAGLISQTDVAMPVEAFAIEAYACADAMLKERDA